MVVSSLRSSTPATRTSGPGAFWSLPLDGLFAEVAASVNGLSADEAARRLARDWPNTIEVAHPHRGLRLLLAQFTSPIVLRSEEHTSELQSPVHLVCRLLLEKKK